MNRASALVEFFRARLDEGPADVEADADRKLLERYDYCVALGGCPGNEDLDVARNEYEDHVFPLRIARFAHHPAYAALVANRWVPEDYAAALLAAS